MAPAISKATHSATSRETRPRCSRTALGELVVRLPLPAISVATGPRIARRAGTREAAIAASTATTRLKSCTRQSMRTAPSVRATTGFMASSAGTAAQARSRPGMSPPAQTMRSSARCMRRTSLLLAPSATRSASSPARATACAEARLAMFTQAISSTSAVAAKSISSGARIVPYCHSRNVSTPSAHPTWVPGNSRASSPLVADSSSRTLATVAPGATSAIATTVRGGARGCGSGFA